MCHVTHTDQSCHTHTNESRHTREVQLSCTDAHTHNIEMGYVTLTEGTVTCHTCKSVMPQTRMSHVTHVKCRHE